MSLAAVAITQAAENAPEDAKDLVARFQRAQVSLANNIGRLVSDIAAHPRHNQHQPELGRLVRLSDQLAECAKIAADRIGR